MQRGIATLLAIALVLWAVGVHMFTIAEAANLTYVKNTLSDSDTGSPSNHTIQFLSPTGVIAGGTIVITFPNGFNIGTSSVNFTDVDFAVNGSEQTLAATPSGATWGVSTTSQNLILTSGTGVVGSNATVTIKIGTNAVIGTTGDAQVTNPSSIGSYEFTITAGASDSGQTRVAIVDNVLVTANVDTTLTFTVSGTTTGAVINGAAPTATNTTSTAIPFETLAAGVAKTLGQDLTVATNARNGYVVTVEQDANLLSSTGADIDGFIDGAYTNAPTAWVAPSNSISDEKTWGHWGLTTTDTLIGIGSEFGSNQWVSASTTPRAIMAHTGPADGTTFGIGRASIGYQIQISALQEAGDDYSTTLTYIATPTF